MFRVAILLLLGVVACAAASPAAPDFGCAKLANGSCPIRREAIQSVEPLYRTTNGKAGPTSRLTGATIVIAAEPGMTKEALERNANCRCPLVSGSTIAVESGRGSYRVEIRSDDMQSAEEILSRARGLAE